MTGHLGGLLGYIVLYFIPGRWSTISLMIGLVLGIMRKAGYPKFNILYAQTALFTQAFGVLTYYMSISLSPSAMFLNAPIFIYIALTLSTEGKKMLDKNPQTPLLSNPKVKEYVLKGASAEIQIQGKNLKSDWEAYVGFYLVFSILVGMSSFIGAIFYWQMMRMRYMFQPELQASFTRIDTTIQSYLHHPYVPAIVGTVYFKIKGLVAGIVDVKGHADKVQENGGGYLGALKSSCTIF